MSPYHNLPTELRLVQRLRCADIQRNFAALRQMEETTSWAYPEARRLIGFRVKEKGESGTKAQAK